MAINPCAVVDALSRFELDALSKINRKFAALQRLAQLLEQLGDLTALAPDLTALIPVESLDLEAYNQIAAACPFLNLPAPGEASLAALKAKLGAAYAQLVRETLGHPWLRMGELQAEMFKFQNKINFTLATGQHFLQCLEAMCAGFSFATGVLKTTTSTDIKKELTKFAHGFSANAGQVLTAPMQEKYSQTTTTVDTLKGLGASIGDDYTTTLAAAVAVPTGPQRTVQSGGVMYTIPPFVPPPAN